MMKLVVLLALLTVCEGSSVVARPGRNVTLSCKYDVSRYGTLAVCWGRGAIPSSGCGDQLVSTDGTRVKEGTRRSNRFQLLGPLEDGDVSMTILNVTKTDAGLYGCRVDVPGWFNDDKHHFDLIVEAAPETTTSPPSSRETSSAPSGQLTSTELLLTSSSDGIMAEDSSRPPVVLVWILCGALVLIAAGSGLIIASRRRRLNKTRQQQVSTSIQFWSPSSSLQLQGSAVENIYQIDDDEYDYCP